MAKEFWTGPARPKAQAILDQLCEEGEPHTWLHAPMLEVKFRALAALLGGRSPLQGRVHWTILRNAVNQCIETKKCSLGDLEAIFSKAGDDDQRAAQGEQQRFCVTLPLDIALGMGLEPSLRLTVDGIELQIIEAPPDLPRPATTVPLEAKPWHKDQTPKPLSIQSIVAAPSMGVAVNRVVEAAFTWRAVANFSAAFTGLSIQFVPGPRAAVPEFRFVTAQEKDKPNSLASEALATHGSPTDPWRELDSLQFLFAKEILDAFDGAPSGTTARLALEAMRLYGVALDQPQWHAAFAILWQVAEHVTVPRGERGRHDEVCKRLVLLTDEPDPLVKEQLALSMRDIERLRHGIVHGGALWSVDDSDVSFLDQRCRDALIWLFRNHKELPTLDHLWAYFRYAHLRPDERKPVTEAIEHLRRAPGADPKA